MRRPKLWLTLPPVFVAAAIHLMPQSGAIAQRAAARASPDIHPATNTALNRMSAGSYLEEPGDAT
jgi:hypothetical protein